MEKVLVSSTYACESCNCSCCGSKSYIPSRFVEMGIYLILLYEILKK